jgi:hypothetical protein
VDFHEPGFVSALSGENQMPFWFQMSDQQRQQAGEPWGPANPQALNRYSYVQNNPLKYTDPSGHVQTDEGGNQYAGYRTAQGEPGETYIDGSGNTIYVDPNTRVMYRIDSNGYKQRVYDIWVWDDDIHSPCDPVKICHKYVYEDDPEFRAFRDAVDVVQPDLVKHIIEDGLVGTARSVLAAMYYKLFPPKQSPLVYFRDITNIGQIQSRKYGPVAPKPPKYHP